MCVNKGDGILVSGEIEILLRFLRTFGLSLFEARFTVFQRCKTFTSFYAELRILQFFTVFAVSISFYRFITLSPMYSSTILLLMKIDVKCIICK